MPGLGPRKSPTNRQDLPAGRESYRRRRFFDYSLNIKIIKRILNQQTF
ncbi:MAG: hypothetical protein V2A64_02815 [Candidatus Omnitrophota bacterium]